MIKIFFRIIASLLVLCLIIDPALADANRLCLSSSYHVCTNENSLPYQIQALTEPILFGSLLSFSHLAQAHQTHLAASLLPKWSNYFVSLLNSRSFVSSVLLVSTTIAISCTTAFTGGLLARKIGKGIKNPLKDRSVEKILLFLLIFWIPVFTVMLYMSGIMPLTALLAIGVFIGGGTANRIEILYFENVFDFIPAPKRMVSSIGDNLAWLGQIVMYVAEVFQLISFTLKLIKSPDLITMIDLGITVLIIALLTAFAVKVAKRCLFRDHPNKTPHQSAGTLANKQAA